jgi:transposase
VKRYIAENKKSEIIWLAEAAGHKALLTPSYYCDLQPIELAWVYIKGKVVGQYNVDTKLQIVYKKLSQAFEILEEDHEAKLGIIEKCTKTAKLLYNEIS